MHAFILTEGFCRDLSEVSSSQLPAGQQDPRKCWSEPANRAVRREPAEGSEAEEGRTVTHREEEWDDERRDTEREARQAPWACFSTRSRSPISLLKGDALSRR